jgi:hypothetical protein
MEAQISSEILVRIYKTTQQHSPEKHNLNLVFMSVLAPGILMTKI